MKKYRYCPYCHIGLSNKEIEMGFCQNCKHSWDVSNWKIDNYDERKAVHQ